MDVFHGLRLDKNVPIPLYYQFKKQVLALIKDSVLRPGDMLPPENELCALLDVSRPTIRQAFSELVAEGYLQRYKGRGTFVAEPKVEDRFLSKLESFNKEMESKGLTPHTEVLALEVVVFAEAGERLGLPPDAQLIHLSRLRSADGVALVYVDTYLPYDHYKDLMRIDFRSASLYESLESVYGVHVSRVQREIEAVNAGRGDAKLLQIAANKAICLVKTLAFSKDGALPVEYSIARYRGDKNKFDVEIYRQEHAT